MIRTKSQCSKCPLRDQQRVWSDHPEGEFRLAFFGESPGKVEARTKHPFTGPAGGYLNEKLTEAHIRRAGCFVGNLISCRPPDDDLSSPEGQEAVACCKPGLEEEIEFIKSKGVRVIVSLGNEPTEYFTGGRGINKLRGSVFAREGQPVVIPTYHPSGILKSQEKTIKRGENQLSSHILGPVFVSDLSKAREIANNDWKAPAERFQLRPSAEEAIATLNRLASEGNPLGVDIETLGWYPETGSIFVVGIAWSPEDAISIPFYSEGKERYWTEEEEPRVIAALKHALASCPTVFQNAKFDVNWLETKGLPVSRLSDDVMLAHHAVSPELPHDLGFIVSIYGRTPAWKDGVLNRDIPIYDIPDDELRTYNLRDSVVLLQVLPKLTEEMVERNVLWTYKNISMKLIRPIIAMEKKGIKVDASRLTAFKKELEANSIELERTARLAAGLFYRAEEEDNGGAQTGASSGRQKSIESIPSDGAVSAPSTAGSDSVRGSSESMGERTAGDRSTSSNENTTDSVSGVTESISPGRTARVAGRLLDGVGPTPLGSLTSDDDLRYIIFGIEANKFKKARVELPLKKRKDTAVYRKLSALVALVDNVTPLFPDAAQFTRETDSGKLSVKEDYLLTIERHVTKRLDLLKKFVRPREEHKLEQERIEKGLKFLIALRHFNENDKLLTTYTKYPVDTANRVHPSLLIHGTTTGRLASKDPNLQNQPEVVRKIFGPEAGYSFISSDYSNLELRVIALMANDDVLIEQFNRHEKIHDMNAMFLFGVTREHTEFKSYKTAAKIYRFGRNYLGSLEGIYEKVMIQVPECGLTFSRLREADERYMALHPRHLIWANETIAEVKRTKRLTNAFGRIRFFFGNKYDILKEGVNFPIQSTAADIINQTTIALYERGAPMILQIHDALLFEVRTEEVPYWVPIIKEEMEREFTVNGHRKRFPVEISTSARSWWEKEMEPYAA